MGLGGLINNEAAITALKAVVTFSFAANCQLLLSVIACYAFVY